MLEKMSGKATTLYESVLKQREDLAVSADIQSCQLPVELQKAIQMAEMYDYVQPQEYILPLDTLAGFCIKVAD